MISSRRAEQREINRDREIEGRCQIQLRAFRFTLIRYPTPHLTNTIANTHPTSPPYPLLSDTHTLHTNPTPLHVHTHPTPPYPRLSDSSNTPIPTLIRYPTSNQSNPIHKPIILLTDSLMVNQEMQRFRDDKFLLLQNSYEFGQALQKMFAKLFLIIFPLSTGFLKSYHMLQVP